MNRQHKIWGERWLIREDSTHNISFLRLKAEHRCSWHCHFSKWNLFVVIRGEVGIKTEHGETRLTDGQCFTVMPGLHHEFRAYTDSDMIEEMFVQYDEGDIMRETVGSTFEIEEKRPNINGVVKHNMGET